MSTRSKLLEALDGKAGQVFAGEALARRLGVTRTAIWKQVQSLKHVGLPIESHGRQGYQIKSPFDSSLLRFKGTSWTMSHHFISTVSTQVLAKTGGASGLPEGHLWIAEMQTKGRGRFERLWESSYGGLWFSLLLRPKLPPARLSPLTLVAGLSLRQAVETVCKADVKLKWPNDLLIRTSGTWKKCAGILTEMSGQMDRTEWVTLGVGLNVNNSLSKALSDRATSLYEVTDQVWVRSAILEAFLDRFHDDYRRYVEAGFEPFRRSYWSHYFAPGKPVSLKTAAGTVSGMARGVDVSGAIMIESRRKTRLFTEGEIIL